MSDFHHTLETICERSITKKEFLNVLNHILPEDIYVNNFSIAHRKDYTEDEYGMRVWWHKYKDSYDVKFSIEKI